MWTISMDVMLLTISVYHHLHVIIVVVPIFGINDVFIILWMVDGAFDVFFRAAVSKHMLHVFVPGNPVIFA
jgi:hypothetical protein